MATKEQLDGTYEMISEFYASNFQIRWSETPYMKESIESGREESVAGHSWGTMMLWYSLKRVAPNLGAIVNSEEVYETLIIHDLGETIIGDTPLYLVINGGKKPKQDERDSLELLTEPAPWFRDELLARHDEFEQDIEKVDRLEVVVAKWLDTLQGNHFALTFGKNLTEHSKKINDILQIRFIPYTNKLLGILDMKGELFAFNEVRQIAKHHIKKIRDAGIDFDTTNLNI